MKKIKIIFLFLCLNILNIAKAQDEGTVTFFGGGGLNFQTSSQFNKFKNSYNNSSAIKFKKKLHQTAIPVSYQFGAIYWIMDNFGLSLNYSNSRIAYRAEFEDNTSRQMIIRNRTPLDFGIAVGLDENYYIHGRFGLLNSSVISKIIFADGTRSMGKENSLNGSYNTVGFFYKLEYSMPIYKKIHLCAGIGGGSSTSSYMDGGDGKSLAGNSSSVLPTNWDNYLNYRANGNLYAYPIEEHMKIKFFQINLGIQYTFTND